MAGKMRVALVYVGCWETRFLPDLFLGVEHLLAVASRSFKMITLLHEQYYPSMELGVSSFGEICHPLNMRTPPALSLAPGPNFTVTQVGENLQDHLVLPTVNTSKPPMVEADYTEDSYHGATYFSCALPPRAPVSSTTDSDSGVSKTAAATTSSSPSAVVGALCFDGNGLAQNLGPNICMLVTRPGFLGALARIAALAVCRVAGWVTPVRRILRGSRGMVMTFTTVKSKGTVRLASGTDASVPPLIDPAYFSHPDDRRVACEGWRMVRRAKSETASGRAVFGSEILPGRL